MRFTVPLISLFILMAFPVRQHAQGVWTQKASFPGNPRFQGCSFSIVNKGYYGMGQQNVDFWEWDQGTNTWTQKANFPGLARGFPVHFAIGAKGYFGCGIGSTNNQHLNDFWEYDPVMNSWTQKANFGGGPRAAATGFGIGTKGYVGTGSLGNTTFNDLWEFDPSTNTWTQKANLPSTPMVDVDDASFTIGGKGYIGTGHISQTDFWEYDPSSNLWTQRATFPGAPREGAVGFSISCRGYIGMGQGFGNCSFCNDFWEWDQATDTWTQVSSITAGNGPDNGSFSIGNNGYVVTLVQNTTVMQLWEYTPTSICTLISVTASYVYTSCSSPAASATVNPSQGTPPYTYTWLPSGQTTQTATGLSQGTHSVFVTDSTGATVAIAVSIPPYIPPYLTFASTPSACGVANGTATAYGVGGQPPYTYSWSNGQTSATATGLLAGTYTAIVTDVNGCTATGITVVNGSFPPSIVLSGDSEICIGNSSIINASGGTSYSWSNGSTSSTISVTPSSTTSYTLIASDGTCSDTAYFVVNVYPPPVAAVSGPTQACFYEPITLSASGGNYYSWNSGQTTSEVTFNPTANSTYTVYVSNAPNCTDSAMITVNVNPVPAAYAGVDVTIVIGTFTTLTASGGGAYSWSTGDTSSSINVSPSTTTTYCVSVTNSFGCSKTDCVTVFVDNECSVFIPSAFSPDNDGMNDILYVRCACMKEMTFKIFDRTGENIFETNDISQGWDGTYKSKAMNSGAYVYYLEGTLSSGTPIKKKGDISLIR